MKQLSFKAMAKYLGPCFWLLVLSCLYLAMGCSSITGRADENRRTGAEQPGKNMAADKQKTEQASSQEQLKLLLSVGSTQWSKEGPAAVSLRIENLTDGPLELTGSMAFELVKDQPKSNLDKVRMSFYAPVDPIKKVTRGPGDLTIHLGKEQVIEVTIDLRDLKWGRSIQAVWPHDGFFETVPPGDYKLSFGIHMNDGTQKLPDVSTEVPKTKQLKSNELTVTIL